MYCFIINPSSSSGRGRKIWEKVKQRLEEEKLPYESFLLGGPGEAGPLAKKLSRRPGPVTLVALGGDGTINEILNGIEPSSSLTFACIPSGSGNDFVRGLSLPSTPALALEAALHPKTFVSVNIGQISLGGRTRSFGVSAGMGYDASVCSACGRSALKTCLNTFRAGKLVYLFSGIKLLFTQKLAPLTVTTEEYGTLFFPRAYFAAVMNLPCEGGGFYFCPKADPADGMLDLCVLDQVSRIRALFLLPLALFGKHGNQKGVQILRCRKAELRSSVPLCVHTDGECVGLEKQLSVSLLPEKLNVIQS